MRNIRSQIKRSLVTTLWQRENLSVKNGKLAVEIYAMLQDQDKTFSKTIRIEASTSRVWEAITGPRLMAGWMSDTEIAIQTDWTVGSPVITIAQSGHDNAEIVNTGIVLAFKPEQKLQYSHFSPLSKLPDQPWNHTIFTFTLRPDGGNTELSLSVSNFPTEAIFKHMVFYWEVTLEILKKFLTQNTGSNNRHK